MSTDDSSGKISDAISKFNVKFDNTSSKITSKVPVVSSMLDSIDSRQAFVTGTQSILRLTSGLLLFLGAYAYLLGIVKLFDSGLGGFDKVIGVLLSILALGGVLFVFTITQQRTRQLYFIRNKTAVSIGFHLLKLTIEIVAFAVLAFWLLQAVASLILGPSGAETATFALIIAPTMAISDLMPSGGDSEVFARIGGLLNIFVALVIGFVYLLVGYIGHDILDTLFKYFSRKSPLIVKNEDE